MTVIGLGQCSLGPGLGWVAVGNRGTLEDPESEIPALDPGVWVKQPQEESEGPLPQPLRQTPRHQVHIPGRGHGTGVRRMAGHLGDTPGPEKMF